MLRTIMALLAIGLLACQLAQVAAQEATPAPARGLDLAAMTLTPSEVAALGLPNFGLANQSSLRDAESDALVQADGDAFAAAERLHVYEEHGFIARYVGSLLRPVVPLESLDAALVAAEMRVSTSVTAFVTPEGAAATFAFNEGPMDDQPGADLPDARPYGDESEVTRSTGTEVTTGAPLQRLELAFRLDNLIGEVTIVNYRDVEPDLATLEALGDALLAKIEAGVAAPGPGLSDQVLRISPMAGWIESARLRDFYTRFDRVSEPTFAQIVGAIRDGVPLELNGTPQNGVAAPLDTYLFWTPLGEGDPLSLPLYVVRISRYASEDYAAAAVAALTADLGEGYSNVLESQVGAEIGDESREFSYRYEGDPSGPVRGHLVTARLEDLVVLTQVDGPEGVTSSGVRVLAEAQIACLEQARPCAPMPVLDALAAIVAGA